jgi:multidrug transporter EmrE-like cation transporter
MIVTLSIGHFQLGGLIFVSVAMAVGQILFKLASQSIELTRGPMPLLASLFSWPMALAVVLYAGALVVWVVVLASVPLSRAYPFMAVAFALVPFLSSIIFGEHLPWSYWLGTAVLICAIAIISTSRA